MGATLLEFAADVMVLTANILPLLVAVGLALLIRGRVHALLIVVNLWLFMELAATVLDSDYRFASLLWPRLMAAALQVAIAYGAVTLWRHWRIGSERMTSH
jgi:hypothetical protein